MLITKSRHPRTDEETADDSHKERKTRNIRDEDFLDLHVYFATFVYVNSRGERSEGNTFASVRSGGSGEKGGSPQQLKPVVSADSMHESPSFDCFRESQFRRPKI